MIRQPISRKKRIVLGICSFLVCVGVYSFYSARQHRINPDDSTMPNISQFKEGIVKAIEKDRRGERWITTDSAATAKRFFLGMTLGIGLAILLGIHMGCFAWVDAFFSPALIFLANLPPTAYPAVFFVMVGTGLEMYVIMIAVGVLPPLAQGIYLAIHEIPDQLIYKAYTLGASRTEVVWNVVTRIIFPKVIDLVRLQIAQAMIFLIAAEMVVGHEGFGYRIRLQSKLINMSTVFPYLVLLGIFGFGLAYILKQLQQLTCPWYSGSTKG